MELVFNDAATAIKAFQLLYLNKAMCLFLGSTHSLSSGQNSELFRKILCEPAGTFKGPLPRFGVWTFGLSMCFSLVFPCFLVPRMCDCW